VTKAGYVHMGITIFPLAFLEIVKHTRPSTTETKSLFSNTVQVTRPIP